MDESSRPRTGAPWALFFALLAFSGAALGVTIFTLVRASTKAKTPARTASTPSTPALPNAPALAPPAPALTPASDLRNEANAPPRGAPASSLRARPAWGKREHLTPHAKVTSQYAPQASNPLETFLAAAPLGPDFVEGALICKFQSFNKHDTFAGDDLHARVTFGATPEMANDGPEDGNLAFVSAPLVHLAKGDRIAYQVFDRDVFGITAMSTTALVFSGGPVVGMDSGAAVECRALVGDALDRAIAARASAATITLAEIERSKPDETRSDWAFPTEPIDRAERQIADTASLAGWDEPRVEQSVAALATATARARADRERLFDRLYAAAGTSFGLGGMTVTATGTDCPGSCVSVTVKNGSRAAAPFGDPYTTIYIANRADGPRWAQMVAADGAAGGSAKIEPGATIAKRIATTGALPEGPLLVAACSRHVCGFARAR